MLYLYNKKYTREELKKNIYALKLLDILKTQKIDAKFAVYYILNKNYQLHKDDKITINIVLHYQPHLSFNMIQKELLNYDSDNDSIKDFECVSNEGNL
jgi:hypothetical protein